MSLDPATLRSPILSRRTFLANTSATLLGGAVLLLSPGNAAPAAHSDPLKIALIGCGKRGSGAANQALATQGPTRLVAMADVAPEQIAASLKVLQKRHGPKVDVSAAHQFVGFDSYREAIALGDVVILTAPPGFRPLHFEEAVKQGKHVFMEKPVAVDAPGVRRILAAAAEAKQKGLKVGVGLQRRHKPGYLEAVRRIQDGACGDLHTLQCDWLGTAREGLERRPGETEMQYQLRNWYFYTWLSGDHIVEQHVHNLDVIYWIKGAHPIRAQGMGGRQVRTGKIHGHIFDHHFVEFERAAISTMIGIMGRMATYSGQVVEWEAAFHSRLDLAPARYAFEADPPILPGPDGSYPVAMPGRTVAL